MSFSLNILLKMNAILKVLLLIVFPMAIVDYFVGYAGISNFNTMVFFTFIAIYSFVFGDNIAKRVDKIGEELWK